jgi:hypothetical protein
MVHIPSGFAERTVSIYQGKYISYRLTPTNESVIASKLEIRCLDGERPRPFFFENIKIDDTIVFEDERQSHKFEHSGPVVYREERLYMLSIASGNIRLMILKAPLSQEFTSLRGIILTVSAAREPYSTKVLLRRVSPDLESNWPDLPHFYNIDDKRIASVLRYIDNNINGSSVLQI